MKHLFFEHILSYVNNRPQFFELDNQTGDAVICTRSKKWNIPGKDVFSFENELTTNLQQTYENVFVYRSSTYDTDQKLNSLRFFMIIPIDQSLLFKSNLPVVLDYQYVSTILPVRSHCTVSNDHKGDILTEHVASLPLQVEQQLLYQILQLPSFRLLAATGTMQGNQ